MRAKRARKKQSHTVTPEGWSARRSRERTKEKLAIAKHFAEHMFLVAPDNMPEDDRETAATILVLHGTTQDSAVGESLRAVADRQRPYGPFINWYSPGALVPTTLLQFRRKCPDLISATKMFLFPGEVDLDIEAACSDDAVTYAESLDVTFTYVFLGAYSCDLHEEGVVYFQHKREVKLQRACALKRARQKVLFLDSTKFRREGHKGYTFLELLKTSENVTIYTVAKDTEHDARLCEEFSTLANGLLVNADDPNADRVAGEKVLLLCMVGRPGKPPISFRKPGFLRRGSVADEQGNINANDEARALDGQKPSDLSYSLQGHLSSNGRIPAQPPRVTARQKDTNRSNSIASGGMASRNNNRN
jgi:hypothetical protein